MIIGILSIDIHGNEFSISEFLESFDTAEEAVSSMILDIDEEPPDATMVNLELPKGIELLINDFAKALTFLAIMSVTLGKWLGQQTAPFHYLLAIVIGFLTILPYAIFWIIAVFTVIIKERKEIKIVVKQGFKDADLKNYCKGIKEDIRLSFKKRFRRIKK